MLATMPSAPDDERVARTRVFALTWLSYAAYYLTRKNFSVAKKTIQDQEGVTKAQLTHIDTAYLAAYAGGQFLWGLVADRAGARRVLAAGMLCTAAASVAFGRFSTFAPFLVIFGLNGIFQATGWSPNVKAMGQLPAVMGLCRCSSGYFFHRFQSSAWCFSRALFCAPASQDMAIRAYGGSCLTRATRAMCHVFPPPPCYDLTGRGGWGSHDKAFRGP